MSLPNSDFEKIISDITKLRQEINNYSNERKQTLKGKIDNIFNDLPDDKKKILNSIIQRLMKPNQNSVTRKYYAKAATAAEAAAPAEQSARAAVKPVTQNLKAENARANARANALVPKSGPQTRRRQRFFNGLRKRANSKENAEPAAEAATAEAAARTAAQSAQNQTRKHWVKNPQHTLEVEMISRPLSAAPAGQSARAAVKPVTQNLKAENARANARVPKSGPQTRRIPRFSKGLRERDNSKENAEPAAEAATAEAAAKAWWRGMPNAVPSSNQRQQQRRREAEEAAAAERRVAAERLQREAAEQLRLQQQQQREAEAAAERRVAEQQREAAEAATAEAAAEAERQRLQREFTPAPARQRSFKPLDLNSGIQIQPLPSSSYSRLPFSPPWSQSHSLFINNGRPWEQSNKNAAPVYKHPSTPNVLQNSKNLPQINHQWHKLFPPTPARREDTHRSLYDN